MVLLPPELPSFPELDPPEALPPESLFLLLSLPELVEEDPDSSSPVVCSAHELPAVAASGTNFTLAFCFDDEDFLLLLFLPLLPPPL